MTRCILCYRCVKVAEQITDGRVHGVINRGDVAEISTYISQAIENDFSGNMIDVCPVGALTDRTFRFASRVWFTNPVDAPTVTAAQVQRQGGAVAEGAMKCCASPVARTNGARWRTSSATPAAFDKKDLNAWTVEGPRKIDRHSVIGQGHYDAAAQAAAVAHRPRPERSGDRQTQGAQGPMIIVAIFLLVLFVVTLTVAAYSTYGERKVAAFLQDRIGPNRAGPFGLLQPLADGLKMFMKEDFIPAGANRTLFFLGPAIAMMTALLTGVVIPWGGTLVFGDLRLRPARHGPGDRHPVRVRHGEHRRLWHHARGLGQQQQIRVAGCHPGGQPDGEL
jgi:hypothetical protein